jgi:hypothetical protein
MNKSFFSPYCFVHFIQLGFRKQGHEKYVHAYDCPLLKMLIAFIIIIVMWLFDCLTTLYKQQWLLCLEMENRTVGPM